MRLTRLACLVASAGLATRAAAQTIAPADFLPLGAGAQWLYQRASGNGPSDLRLDVIDVNQASTGTRYVLEVPFEGFTSQVRLEIANDRSLLLRAFEAQLNDIVGIVARGIRRLDYVRLCGLVAGSMTDPPGLAYGNALLGGDVVSSPYAAVYPLTMVLRVVAAQILALVSVAGR